MNSDIHFKRQHKFKLDLDFPNAPNFTMDVLVEKRPQLIIFEKENKDGSLSIEKQRWSPLITSYYSTSVTDENLQKFYKLLGGFYQFGSDLFNMDDPHQELDKIREFLGSGTLTVYSLTNVPLEKWTLMGLWPHAINFGDLCYSSSEEIEIQITWQFQNAKYESLAA